MGTWSLDVVRAEDLLVLRFEFVNLALDPDESLVPRRLVRESATDEAVIIVHFQPQHIAEPAFHVRPDGITLDDFPQPGGVFPSLTARESRLGFRLPPNVDSIPLTLERLLDWNALEPIYTLDEEEREGIVRPVTKPLAHHTAIEIPFRLTLSPDSSGLWQHSARPVSHNGTADLWHTRLLAAEGRERPPQLWAIWSPDAALFQSADIGLATSLSKDQRGEIAELSSDFLILDPSNFEGLDADQLEQLRELRRSRLQWLDGEELMLTPLGGTLRTRSRFFFPPLGELIHSMKGHELDPTDVTGLFSLEEWAHVAVMGRDQFVRVTGRGFLYPLGHRATLVTVSERQLLPSQEPNDFEFVAYLTKKEYLVVQEPERSYDFRDLPFVRAKITNLVATNLDPAQDPGEPHVLMMGGVPAPFSVLATDKLGQSVKLSMPLIFVPADKVNALDKVSEEYQSRMARCDMQNQSVAFVENGPPATVLTASAMRFGHDVANPTTPPFRPRLVNAEVRLPSVEQFAAQSKPITIAYHDMYVKSNFAGSGGVFAKFIDAVRADIPAEKVGGLAAPNVTLDGLSRDLGAVPNVEALVSNFSSPATLQLPNSKLLGVISLDTLIAAATGSAQLPKFNTEVLGDGQQIVFTWTPTLKEPDEILKLLPGAELFLQGSISAPVGGRKAPLSEITGEFKNFALEFAGLVRVEFDVLKFHMVGDKAPEFDPDVKSFKFLGELEFLEKLQTKIPGLSGTGASIAVSPAGVSAGLTIAAPDLALGALSLQNLAVSAMLELFFATAARLTFGLSSRERPFLISYSLLGGGGYFSLTVSSDKNYKRLEAGLEFGAVAAINLFIARGAVQAMVGVYFSIEKDKAKLTGQIRLYGCLEVLEIASISVEFLLSLSYDGTNATGHAALTVSVRVLAFSKSVTLEVTRSFSTSDSAGPLRRFNDALTLEDWTAYCKAFA